MQKVDFKAQANKAFQAVKNYEQMQNWVQFSNKPCLQYSIKQGQRNVIKSIHQFKCEDYDKLVQYLDGPNCLKDTDSLCQSVQQLFREGDYKISHFKFKGIMLVSKRDFIVAVNIIRQKDKTYRVCKSIDYKDQIKGYVRGYVHLGAYVAQRLQGDKVRLTYFSDSDVKGSIPEMVKNMISKQQGVVAFNIEKKFNERLLKTKK